MARTLKEVILKWTIALKEVEARKKVFTNIRDIEYTILSGQFSLKERVDQVLIDRKGFCLSKHYLLGELFKEMGYKVHYCTYAFNWAESGLALPARILDIARKLPVTYHVACKVLLEDDWILVDATWDKFLETIGFSVNYWDGEKNTSLAVKSIEEFENDNMAIHQIFYQKKIKEYSFKENLILARFTKIFNEWLNSVRMRT